ncbi:MAG: hypothetical protein AB1646_03770 [Thermodesulfobacteriota bacterium]
MNERKSTNVRFWSGLLCALMVLACQGNVAWGQSSWFDWSDFRATTHARVFLAKLDAASLRSNAGEVDLKKALGISDGIAPFREFFGELYIDRLGFRWYLEDDRAFSGTLDTNLDSVSTLDLSAKRVGLDIDVIRFPYFRLGVSADYTADRPKLWDRRSLDGQYFAQYTGPHSVTAGLHARALPLRIKEVPVTLESRVRFPVPLGRALGDKDETRITEFELAGGLRPAVWETSLFGHATFSASLELGYRWSDMKLTINDAMAYNGTNALVPSDVTLKARWSGAFFQVALFY